MWNWNRSFLYLKSLINTQTLKNFCSSLPLREMCVSGRPGHLMFNVLGNVSWTLICYQFLVCIISPSLKTQSQKAGLAVSLAPLYLWERTPVPTEGSQWIESTMGFESKCQLTVHVFYLNTLLLIASFRAFWGSVQINKGDCKVNSTKH